MGQGSGTALLIIVVVIYFTFMGMLANALGYTAPSVVNFSNEIANINIGYLSFLFDIISWVVSVVAGYFSLIAFSIGGDIPVWIGAIAIVPVTLGLGWVVVEMIRG